MKNDLEARSVAYALRVINLYRALPKDGVGRVLGEQLLRAGTSIGANLHEAQGAQSRADFIAKVSVAHKEAREAAYWLRLIRDAALTSASRLEPICAETDELVRILSSSLLTAKQRTAPKP